MKKSEEPYEKIKGMYELLNSALTTVLGFLGVVFVGVSLV